MKMGISSVISVVLKLLMWLLIQRYFLWQINVEYFDSFFSVVKTLENCVILHWLNQIFAEANGFIIPWHSLLDRYGKTIYSENEQLNARMLHLNIIMEN